MLAASAAGGERFGHGDVLHHADEGEDQRRYGQPAQHVDVGDEEGERRESVRHAANDGDAGLAVEVESDHRPGCGGEHQQRHQAHGEGGGRRRDAAADEQTGQPAARRVEHDERRRADQQRRQAGLRQVLVECAQRVQRARPGKADAEQELDLADDDEYRRPGDEAADHRPAEQARKETETKHAAGQDQHAGIKRERRGESDVVGAAGRGERTQYREGHDRGDRHRADGLRHAAADQGVGDHRENADVEAGLRRQSG